MDYLIASLPDWIPLLAGLALTGLWIALSRCERFRP